MVVLLLLPSLWTGWVMMLMLLLLLAMLLLLLLLTTTQRCLCLCLCLLLSRTMGLMLLSSRLVRRVGRPYSYFSRTRSPGGGSLCDGD